MRKNGRDEKEKDTFVVADMSAVEKPGLFRICMPHDQGRAGGKRPEPLQQVEPGQTKWYVLGALKAGLLIAGAFIVGLGIIVLLMVLLY